MSDLVVAGHKVTIDVAGAVIDVGPYEQWTFWCRTCNAFGTASSEAEVREGAEGHVEDEMTD